jgi:flagellar biosynthesis/type III secretory pathway chaperone
MTNEQLLNAFRATVQASLHGAQTLEAVLEREAQALTGRDPAALEAVVKEKLALLQQLQHSVQARDRLQQAAGHPTGNPGAAALVDASGDPTLSADWQSLLAHAATIARLNDRNGQLAAQGQRATRQAIGILTGREATEHTYSAVKHRRRAVAGYSLAIV